MVCLIIMSIRHFFFPINLYISDQQLIAVHDIRLLWKKDNQLLSLPSQNFFPLHLFTFIYLFIVEFKCCLFNSQNLFSNEIKICIFFFFFNSEINYLDHIVPCETISYVSWDPHVIGTWISCKIFPKPLSKTVQVLDSTQSISLYQCPMTFRLLVHSFGMEQRDTCFPRSKWHKCASSHTCLLVFEVDGKNTIEMLNLVFSEHGRLEIVWHCPENKQINDVTYTNSYTVWIKKLLKL